MQHDLKNMPVHDLCELLFFTTTELLNAFQEKQANGAQIHILQTEIQEIREALTINRGDSSRSPKINFLI